MIFRKTTKDDLQEVNLIFIDARRTMREAGIPQWQDGDGYPAVDDILKDITNGEGYVLEDEGQIAATCAVLLNGEPSYTVITEGQWLTESPDDADCTYLTVHRVATSAALRGRGYASRLMEEAIKMAHAASKKSIRIDTHRLNLPMQRMLARNGFVRCGAIRLENGAERIGFEKLLQTATAQCGY